MLKTISGFSSFWDSGAFHAGKTGGVLIENFNQLMEALKANNTWDFLSNPLIIVLTILLFLFFTLKRSTKSLAFLGAVWGYAIVYHFTIGMGDAGNEMLQTGTTHGVTEMVTFFGGVFLVTIVALYFVVKGN